MSHLIHYLDDYLLMDFPRSPGVGTTSVSDPYSRQVSWYPCCHGQTGRPQHHPHLPGTGTRLSPPGGPPPTGKAHTILTKLSQWSKPRKTTKRRLLSLLGLLSFTARAIPVGRLFLCRLISLSTMVEQLHHHIQLNSEAIADITWWQTFLPDWNLTLLCITPSLVL